MRKIFIVLLAFVLIAVFTAPASAATVSGLSPPTGISKTNQLMIDQSLTAAAMTIATASRPHDVVAADLKSGIPCLDGVIQNSPSTLFRVMKIDTPKKKREAFAVKCPPDSANTAKHIPVTTESTLMVL